MRWTILPALAGAIGLAATTATAADMAVDPAMDWSGFYAGLSAGLASVNDEMQGFRANVGPWEPWVGGDNSGLALGAQLGVNHQMDAWVLGLEGQFMWANDIGGDAINPNGRPPINYDVNWLAAIGPRVGYAVGDALLYAKGGLALADVDYAHAGGPSSASHTAYGFMLGAGAEYAFSPSLSGRIDYSYLGFSTDTVNLTTAAGAIQIPVKHDPDAHVVTVGLNYHF